MKEKSFIVLNSTVLYVTAFLITTILHEFSHGLAGLFNDSHPILHHNYVEHLSINHLSIHQRVSIALAGPVLSLFQGLAAGWIFLNSQKQRLVTLFLLWFSVLGFNNFLGYLITGPLFSAGDIGKAYLLLNTPLWIQILVSFLGAAALLFLAYKLTAPFLSFSFKSEWVANRLSRKNFSFRIIILPWLIGSVIMTILYLPIIAIVSIVYPIMSGFVFIYPWQNAQRIENVELSSTTEIGNVSYLTIFVLLALTIVFKLKLAPGIQL